MLNMIHKVHDGYHHKRRQAEVMSDLYFVEVSSGIYYVHKDRMGKFTKDYVGSRAVSDWMSMALVDVAIERIDGVIILNNSLSIKLD